MLSKPSRNAFTPPYLEGRGSQKCKQGRHTGDMKGKKESQSFLNAGKAEPESARQRRPDSGSGVKASSGSGLYEMAANTVATEGRPACRNRSILNFAAFASSVEKIGRAWNLLPGPHGLYGHHGVYGHDTG
jgi:hypothetical protein